MKKTRILEIIREEIHNILSERVFIDPNDRGGRDISVSPEGQPVFGTVAGASKNAINAIIKSYPELKSEPNIVASFLLSAKARKNDFISIKGMEFEVKPHILDALLAMDEAVASQEDAYENPKTRQLLQTLANKAGSEFDLTSYMDFIGSGRGYTPSLGGPQTRRFATKTLGLEEEEQLNEMAKLVGDLKAAIEKVIKSNPDLSGLPLKKAIKANASVKKALGDQTLHDNQLNNFIAVAKGEKEVGKRGRKADPNKPKAKKKEGSGRRGRPAGSGKPKDDEEKVSASTLDKKVTTKKGASEKEVAKATQKVVDAAKQGKKLPKGASDVKRDQYDKVVKDMKDGAAEYRKAKTDGDDAKMKTITKRLKDLTAKRDKLIKDVESAVADTGKGQELKAD